MEKSRNLSPAQVKKEISFQERQRELLASELRPKTTMAKMPDCVENLHSTRKNGEYLMKRQQFEKAQETINAKVLNVFRNQHQVSNSDLNVGLAFLYLMLIVDNDIPLTNDKYYLQETNWSFV